MSREDGSRGLFSGFAARWRPAVESALEEILPAGNEAPARLHQAMRYAMFPGGKRLRPLLALVAAEVTGGSPERALRPAAALELVHTYSLVHDDLPCMDDDALRRGRATCHRAFDEATALLCGDALLTLALEVVAEGGAEAVAVLARAAGSLGMVGGQVGDLEAEGAGRDVTLEQLEWIHDRKTAALIGASLEVGLLAGGGPQEPRPLLSRYGQAIGRAFQIADDLLDVTGTAEELGKEPGQDVAHDKATYPALLGLEASRAAADQLVRAARELAAEIAGPAGLDSGVELLQDVAISVVARRA